MTNPSARAVASVAVCAAGVLIAFASPAFAIFAVLGMVAAVYLIWEGA